MNFLLRHIIVLPILFPLLAGAVMLFLPEARRHLNWGDRQIEAAAELLRRAGSPDALFRLAAERGSEAPRVARPGGAQ